MWTAWALYRAVKLLAVVLFIGGAFVAATHGDRVVRARAAAWAVTPGLIGTWLMGYALLKNSGRELSEPWVLWAMAASFSALHGSFLAAQRDVPTRAAVMITTGGAFSAMGVMAARDSLALSGLMAGALPLLLAYVASEILVGKPGDSEGSDETIRSWFRWVSWAEGLSLIFMMGFAMPYRRITGTSLDGGMGYVGWTHGLLLFVYVQGLVSMRTLEGWSVGKALIGLVSSVIPFGTMVFERWALKADPK